MSFEQVYRYIDTLEVTNGKSFRLKDFETDYDRKSVNRAEGEALLVRGIRQLADMQDKLYAHNQYSLLLIFQAMDAAGKDGVIRHVMSGLNPQGVRVTSFKAPSAQELDHDYFWRHSIALPARGEIGIFNRSHYENVLVTRVYPSHILQENLPQVQQLEDIGEDFWESRYKQIRRFEKNLQENGTLILKFMLHVSKKEQKKRLLDRIDDASKNWKFSMQDLKARADWDRFMSAYEHMIQATAHPRAPWFIIPADDKWFARLSIAAIIHRQFERMKLAYPKPDPQQKKDLKIARQMLMDETDE